MAITSLVNFSNRYGSDVYLQGALSAVAVDATVAEDFILPTGFGSLLIKSCNVFVAALSGTYVAPAPPFDGFEVHVLSSDGTTRVDIVGVGRWTVYGTTSARPNLALSFDFNNMVLMRLGERIRVGAPIIGGAGVTASVQLGLRGIRFQTA